MEVAPEEMTVGLKRKHQDNEIESYRNPNALDETMLVMQFKEALMDSLLRDMREHPEEFFNFGFNFNDFKTFLLKLVFMRAERRFIERGLNEKLRYEQANYNNYRQMEGEEDPAAANAAAGLQN